MTFTETDAQNDGKIKKEAGPVMAQVAARSSGELYDAFMNVCERTGREPSRVFGDLLIKALNNESFSERILQTEVDMSVIRADDIREDDLEFVHSMAEKFDLTPSDSKSPLERLVESRIEAQAGAGLTQFAQQQNGGSGEVDPQVRRLNDKVERLEMMLEEAVSDEDVSQDIEEANRSKKDVDDLFDDDGGGEEISQEDEVVETPQTEEQEAPTSTADGTEGDS